MDSKTKKLLGRIVGFVCAAAAFGIILYAAMSPCSCEAGGFEIKGRVVGVSDGDTLVVLDGSKHSHRVRLAEIDAPEKRQAFGERSKQSLSDLCYGKSAVVKAKEYDRYGRVVGRVFCEGIDANAAQVERGMAWVYERYSEDPALRAYQAKAQREKRGLWAAANPTPPWEFRHR